MNDFHHQTILKSQWTPVIELKITHLCEVFPKSRKLCRNSNADIHASSNYYHYVYLHIQIYEHQTGCRPCSLVTTHSLSDFSIATLILSPPPAENFMVGQSKADISHHWSVPSSLMQQAWDYNAEIYVHYTLYIYYIDEYTKLKISIYMIYIYITIHYVLLHKLIILYSIWLFLNHSKQWLFYYNFYRESFFVPLL